MVVFPRSQGPNAPNADIQDALSFYRKRDGRWYDEIRYDSHERKRGRKIPAPHLHAKLQSGRKGEIAQAAEEIKNIIDNYVPELEDVIR
ncbi:MAG: hypothetical protein HY315_09625 [Acidobacteria bacterium]|nr:hypothetical protein [Acidobacteriota bacterium]